MWGKPMDEPRPGSGCHDRGERPGPNGMAATHKADDAPTGMRVRLGSARPAAHSGAELLSKMGREV